MKRAVTLTSARAWAQPSADRRGSVLIIVLWVSLALVAIAITFGHSMLMNFRGANNELAGRQAEDAIEGASRYAEVILTTSWAATPALFPDVTTYQSEAVAVGDATFWFIGRDNNNQPTSTPVFGLIDEASKLNLNTATEAMLEFLPGMTPDVAGSIYNWCHPEANGVADGAESSTYMSQQPPYIAKNDKYESIEELALIYNMNSILLYGEDANLNGAVDPNEDDGDKNPPSDNSNGQLDPGILEYVTCYTKEPNTQSDGTAKVNVTDVTANNTALTDLLTNKLNANRAAEIQGNLRTNPWVGAPSVLQFYMNSGMTEDEFSQIADSITVSTGQYVPGLVNVNTASLTVLSCLPGLSNNPNLAQAIVSQRLGRAATDTSIIWVINAIGDPATARQLGPFITGKSYQVMADVAAVGRNGRGYRRARFIIDMSNSTNGTPTPQIIYRRDLSHLGWALGKDVHEALLSGKYGYL